METEIYFLNSLWQRSVDTDTRVRGHACPPLSADTDMDTDMKYFETADMDADTDITNFEAADTDADTDITNFVIADKDIAKIWIADTNSNMKNLETAFSFGGAHTTGLVI